MIRLDVDNADALPATDGLLNEVVPGVSVVVGEGTAPLSQEAADVATRTAAAQARKLRSPTGIFGDPAISCATCSACSCCSSSPG